MNNRIFLNHLSVTDIAFIHTYRDSVDKYPMKNKGRFHHGLLYTLTSTETYHFKDCSIKATPGSVVYIPKGESYKITLDGEESVVITIDFEITGEPVLPFKIDFPEMATIKSYFQDIVRIWEGTKSNYLPECKSYFYKIVSILSKQTFPILQASKFDNIEISKEYIKENFLKNDFSVETLAQKAQISRRYFEILFKQRYNITPKAYIISLKLERAKELLLIEKLRVKDIAIMLGYSDIYHFGKIFKEKTGYTPSQYRHIRGL